MPVFKIFYFEFAIVCGTAKGQFYKYLFMCTVHDVLYGNEYTGSNFQFWKPQLHCFLGLTQENIWYSILYVVEKLTGYLLMTLESLLTTDLYTFIQAVLTVILPITQPLLSNALVFGAGKLVPQARGV